MALIVHLKHSLRYRSYQQNKYNMPSLNVQLFLSPAFRSHLIRYLATMNVAAVSMF
jgi:hypothetical protein